MEKTSSSELSNMVGQERLKSDKRQLGGMLILTGIPALVFPLASVASIVGANTEIGRGIPMTSLVGGICVITMGLMSVPAGYLQAVHDWGHKYLTAFLILLTQLAWVPFITDLTDVGRGARTGAPFVPAVLEPTEADTRVVGAMGMLGILCYAVGFLGSLGFVQFSLFAYQSGKPGDRPGSYFRSRLRLYAFVNFLGGFSQLFLGAYILKNFGNGPLQAPVSVAMYFVSFPEISVAVGCYQVLNALYGLARSFGVMDTGDSFQITTLIQWWITVILQILVQVAYAEGGMAAAMAPSQVMLTMGISVMVAYLDYKMRTTPESLPENYYGQEAPAKAAGNSKDPAAAEDSEDAEEVMGDDKENKSVEEAV